MLLNRIRWWRPRHLLYLCCLCLFVWVFTLSARWRVESEYLYGPYLESSEGILWISWTQRRDQYPEIKRKGITSEAGFFGFKSPFFKYPSQTFIPSWQLPTFDPNLGQRVGRIYIALPSVVPILFAGCSIYILLGIQTKHQLGKCAKCGYDLVGSTANRCPECGTSVKIPTQV